MSIIFIKIFIILRITSTGYNVKVIVEANVYVKVVDNEKMKTEVLTLQARSGKTNL